MKKIINSIFYTLVIIGSITAHQVFSAGIIVEPSLIKPEYDQSARIDVYVDTQNELINTISGSIRVDTSSTITQVMTGNSLISLWMDTPTINETKQSVSFSGITPGGITTDHGYLFSLIITSNNPTVTVQSFDSYLLKHDGQGTVFPSTESIISVPIVTRLENPSVDTIAPARFKIIRTHNKAIFDDNKFIVFATTDKASGIDQYRICEWFTCNYGDSPYELKNQSLWYVISVHAYDHKHNVTTAYLVSFYVIIIFAIIFLFSILGILYVLFIRKK